MRVTITLDDDVAALIASEQERTGEPALFALRLVDPLEAF
jgi:hypothetical protein